MRAQQSAPALKDARATLEKWLETQKSISREKADWDLARQILGDRIKILEREIQGLEGHVSEARGDGRGGAESAELAAERARLGDVATLLERRLAALEERVSSHLPPLLPDVLRQRIEPMMRGSTGDARGTLPSLAARWQNLITILDEVAQFNGKATVVNERRAASDGKAVDVQTLYLGLGQAFYANAAAGIAGRGVPGESGWQWEEIPGAAKHIANAIHVVATGRAAAPVTLPITIK